MADVKLLVNKRVYGGWKSVRVTRGIESVTGSFELSVSDRWAGQAEPWPIAEEDECIVQLGETVVITGYVDRVGLGYGPEEHELSVSGRDKAGDLVDCSAVLEKWEFQGLSFDVIAQRLAQPFGVQIAVSPDLQFLPLKKRFAVEPGDTAFEAIERGCRNAGVLPISDGLGGLLLTRAGHARAVVELVEGENIKSASSSFDASARYRRYVVTAQQPGSDELWGIDAATVKAEAADDNVRRASRVLLTRAEGTASVASAKTRAQWEATVRAARAETVQVTVQGWRQGGSGPLWPVNGLVNVRSPSIRVKGEMLITQATYALDDSGGEVTELELKRPDAFLPQLVITTLSTKRWKELNKGAL